MADGRHELCIARGAGFVPGTLTHISLGSPGSNDCGQPVIGRHDRHQRHDPTFNGTADPGTTVALMEGTTVLGQTTAANVSGDWSIMVPDVDALSTGDHDVRRSFHEQTGRPVLRHDDRPNRDYADIQRPVLAVDSLRDSDHDPFRRHFRVGVSTGTVAITLDGDEEDAPIGPTGTFSFVFDTSSFHVSHGAYGITYAYEPSGLKPAFRHQWHGHADGEQVRLQLHDRQRQQTYGTAATWRRTCRPRSTRGSTARTWRSATPARGTRARPTCGTYAITGVVADGTGLASDYAVTLTNGTLTVNKYAFSYTIGNDSQTYGTAATLAADLPATIDTRVNGAEPVDQLHQHGATRPRPTWARTPSPAWWPTARVWPSDYAVTLTDGTLTVNQYAFSYTIGNDSQTYGTAANLAADLGHDRHAGQRRRTWRSATAARGTRPRPTWHLRHHRRGVRRHGSGRATTRSL